MSVISLAPPQRVRFAGMDCLFHLIDSGGVRDDAFMMVAGLAREMLDLLYQQRTDLIRQLAAEVKTYIAVSQEEREREIASLGQKLARCQSLRKKDFEAIIQELGERSSERAGQILAALQYFSEAETKMGRKLISPVGDGAMPGADACAWQGQVNKLRIELETTLLSFVAEQEEIKAALRRLTAAEGVTVRELKHVVARLQEKWRVADVYLGDRENEVRGSQGAPLKFRKEELVQKERSERTLAWLTRWPRWPIKWWMSGKNGPSSPPVCAR